MCKKNEGEEPHGPFPHIKLIKVYLIYLIIG